MSFDVSDDCMELGLRAGAILFRDVRIAASPLSLQAEMAEEVNNVRRRFVDVQSLRATPELAKLHDVYRSIGISPRKTQPASQRLAQLVLKRGELPRVNNLVDSYNVLSVRSLCCLGAHDVNRLSLPVTLKLLSGGETFTPMGGENEEAVNKGEFAYVDAKNRVVCRLDVVQAEFSKVTNDSTGVLLIIEGTTIHGPDRLREVFMNTIDLVKRYCGGNHEIVWFPY